MIEEAIQRAPFIRFAQSCAEIGNTTPGAIGISFNDVDVLEQYGLLNVSRREAREAHGVRRRRRFWRFSRGPRLAVYRDFLHTELRNRNLPLIADFDDGVGRAEFRKAWHEEGRASDIKAAALRAFRHLQENDR